jgi:hypothetical protein
LNVALGVETEFEELCLMVAVPCIVVANENGLTLAAYDFAWENGTAAIVNFPTTDSRFSQLSLGQSVRYQRKKPAGAIITPSEPLDADSIRRLENARREFLPKLYAD